MPRDPDNPPAPADGAQQGATQRNKQKNAVPDDLLNHLFDNELSPRQQRAIELLLRGLSDAETAAQLGVDRGTIYRWRTDDPKFADALETQRRILWQQSAQRLRTMYQPALDVLEKQLTGPDPRMALRAAALLLRVASPARLEPLSREPAPSAATQLSHSAAPRPRPRRSATGDDDAFAAFLDAYINAPLPGDAGRQCDANANALPPFADHEGQHDDDDDEEADLRDEENVDDQA